MICYELQVLLELHHNLHWIKDSFNTKSSVPQLEFQASVSMKGKLNEQYMFLPLASKWN